MNFSFKKFMLSENITTTLRPLSIPKLDIYDQFESPDRILKTIIQHYTREAEFQKNKGGIRNPSAILINKIRHIITNYDMVRDKITDYKNKQILKANSQSPTLRQQSIDSAYADYQDLTIEAFQELYALTEEIISLLPEKIEDPYHPNVIITRNQLQKENERYLRKSIKELT